MRISLLVFPLFLIFNTQAFAQFLVYKTAENIQIREKIKESKIDITKLGTRITPFYFYEDNKHHALYRRYDNRCLKLTVSNSIKVSKSSCSTKNLNFTLKEYPNFRSLSLLEIKETPEEEWVWRQKLLSGRIDGFSFKYFLRDIHMDGDKTPTLDAFDFSFNSKLTINRGEKGFSLVKEVIFEREKFHFYPKRELSIKNVLKLDANDFLFTNDQGVYLLIKRFQPGIFDFKYLQFNSSMPEYLSTLPEKLFSYQNEKVCFMDYHIDHSPFDCEFLATNDGKFGTYQAFSLLEIDTVKNSLKVLK